MKRKTSVSPEAKKAMEATEIFSLNISFREVGNEYGVVITPNGNMEEFDKYGNLAILMGMATLNDLDTDDLATNVLNYMRKVKKEE